jgi:2-oxoglutarate ferredoxin oxidoreductase subunit gamma
METKRIVFSGAGGQGVVTAAIILAEAAAIHEGLNAVQTQSYGPEARGGATRSDVVISEEPIRYPKVINPHYLVCLTQEAYNKYSGIIRPGGICLTDNHFVRLHSKVDARQVELSMYENVMKELGKPIVFNICILGALIAITHLVQADSVIKVLEIKIPPAFLSLNRKALELGLKIGKS